MDQLLRAYIVWILQSAALAGQAYLAYLAQTNSKWAWLMPVVSMAQTTMPNPLKAKK